jgi:uncharacterized integral membrane protein
MKLPRMIRNLWIYRRLLVIAVLLGVALFFMASNRQSVTVSFPFIGDITSSSGIVMLVSAGLGAVVCWLGMTLRHALREARRQQPESPAETTEKRQKEPSTTETGAAKKDPEDERSAGP